MNLLSKPHNHWGRVRIAALVVAACVLGWTALAALLRSIGPVPWLAWSGYAGFSFASGLELALVPLAAALAAWEIEEHNRKETAEQAHQQETERIAAAHRKERIQRALATGREGGPYALGAAVRAALAELNGKGRGELLLTLAEKHLLRAGHAPLDLRGADFSGAALANAHLHAASLEGINLSGARLDGAHLSDAHLARAVLEKAVLRRADLRGALLAGCSLAGARLDHASLTGADLRGANLQGALLLSTDLKKCLIDPAEGLAGAILVDAVLPDGSKTTNEAGKAYLKDKELEAVIDRL